MSNWVTYVINNKEHFGTLSDGKITSYKGNMFDEPIKTDSVHSVNDVQIINPCKPSKMMWSALNIYFQYMSMLVSGTNLSNI